MTESERQSYAIRGRIGAYRLHALQGDTGQKARAAAETALNAKLLAEIAAASPGLSGTERARRLGFARKAHFARLALARHSKR